MQKWNRELASVLQLADVREALMQQGMVPALSNPEEVAKQIAADIDRWKKFIAETGITAD